MTRILDRYVGRQFLTLFGVSLAILITISIIVDVFENIHRFVLWGSLASDVVVYYMYTIPKWTLRVAPVALLIAAFLSVGRLSRNYELVAIQMARVPPLRAVLPIMFLAFGITLGLYIVQEKIAPDTNEEALRIRAQELRRLPRYRSTIHRSKTQDIWYLAGSDRMLHIGFLESTKGEMREVSLFHFSPGLVLVQRIDAVRGRWEGGRWILSEARIHRFSKGGSELTVTEVPEMPVEVKATPEDLARVEKKVEEMSYRELKRYIRRLTRSGVDAQRYVADLLAKPARLAANLIMALLGIVFAFRVGRKGLLIHVGTCIATAFLYWLFFALTLPIARNNLLPPLLTVWFPNVVFGGVALLGLLRPRIRI